MPTQAAKKRKIEAVALQGPEIIAYLLANLKYYVVTGGNADTNLACADADGRAIGAKAIIISAVEFATGGAVQTNRTHQCSVTAAGYIQCSVATNSDQLGIWAFDIDDTQ